jgi:asparagine synthase (glutamine-hydrolysing)
MSSFFGIFRPQGGPVDLESFEDMRKASERDGFDGMSAHVEEKLAMGHLMLRVSPEDQYDRQPLKSSCGRYLMVGHFRLDYRDELGDKIGLSQAELEKTPDSTLAMMAYQKWGIECVRHIEGDWAFVLFNRANSSIVFLKDKLGYSALYYTLIGDQLYFSSKENTFLSIKNNNFETDLIYFETLFVDELTTANDRTLINGVKYLNPSTVVIFSEKLESFSNCYWQIGRQKLLNYKLEDDCLADYKSIFFRAVRSRIKSTNGIGILLSSGLDSNAVAAVASKELELIHKRLYSFTSCPAYLDRYPAERHEKISERFLLEKQLNETANIVPEFVDFKEASFGEILSKVNENHVGPLLYSINIFWITGLSILAKNKKADQLLTGQLGNFVFSWNAPNYLLYLLVTLKLKHFFFEFYSRITNGKKSFLGVLRSELFFPSLALVKAIAFHFFPFKKLFYYKRAILRKHLSASLKTSQFNLSKSFSIFLNPAKLRAEVINRFVKELGSKYYYLGARQKINFVDPYCDARIIDFSFSIPESYYCKNGEGRYMARKLMEGLVSTEILQNKKAFLQSYDIFYRLSNDVVFQELIEEINADLRVREFIDTNRIKSLFHEMKTVENNTRKIFLCTKLIKYIYIIQLFRSRIIS